MTSTVEDTRAANDRLYGWILAIASPLALIGLANHPVAPGGDFLAGLKAFAQFGYINSIVHGFLIAMMIAILFGFIGFSRRLGFDRPLVQAAFLAQVVGVFAALSAAVIDGWVFRRLAIVYSSATPDQADMIRGLFNLAGSILFTWGKLWLIGLSTAMLLWSIALLRHGRAASILGVYGIGAGAVAALGSLAGILPLTVPVTASIFGAVALWGTAAGILLIRQKL